MLTLPFGICSETDWLPQHYLFYGNFLPVFGWKLAAITSAR